MEEESLAPSTHCYREKEGESMIGHGGFWLFNLALLCFDKDRNVPCSQDRAVSLSFDSFLKVWFIFMHEHVQYLLVRFPHLFSQSPLKENIFRGELNDFGKLDWCMSVCVTCVSFCQPVCLSVCLYVSPSVHNWTSALKPEELIAKCTLHSHTTYWRLFFEEFS